MKLQDPVRYQPLFCEENVWWLCQDPGLAKLRRRVVFISNATRTCLLEHQRAGGEGGEVVWDYHVVLMTAADKTWWVWDLDTLLGMPVEAQAYLTATFAVETAPPLAPMFRVIDGPRFVATFTTDRSHMRAPDGRWLHPPPAWPPPAAPNEPMNLMRFVDVTTARENELLDLTSMFARYGGDPERETV